jgi:predicted permease
MSFELRAALRSLRHAPGFTAGVVLTLALGIGLTTAMFAAVNAWILEPLPYGGEGRLFALRETTSSGRAVGVSKDDLRDLSAQAASVESAAALLPRTFGLGGADQPAVVLVGMFTGDPFRVLGAPPLFGRPPTPDDELPGRTKVAWISHATWRLRFASDPRLVGSTVRLNEEPYVVAGILPEGFVFPLEGRAPELYVPLDGYEGRSVRSLTGIVRLRSGAGPASALDELRGVAGRLASLAPRTNAGIGVTLRPLHDELLGDHRQSLLLLLCAVTLLLLVTCANVANLLLTRALARQRSLAIRLGLGASTGQLLRESFLEAALLCLGAGLCGLAVAWASLSALSLLPRFVPTASGMAWLRTPRLDPATVSFALLLSFAVALAFAPLPSAILRRLDAHELLHGGGAPPSTGRLRTLLIAAEVALSVVLLTNCGLLVRSLQKVIARDPGFEASGAVAFGIGLPEVRYSNAEKLLGFHEQALAKLAALPHVKNAGMVWRLPLSGRQPSVSFEKQGEPAGRHAAAVAVASPGAFEALRIPLLQGRFFEASDRPGHPAVVAVNRAFARAFFRDGEAAGRRIVFGWDGAPPAVHEIIAVVGDTPQQSLEEPPSPLIWLPLGQAPLEGAHYVLRTSLDAKATAPLAQEAIRSIDSSLEKLEVRPLSSWQDAALTDRRAAASLLGFFAAAALGLSALGIFAAVSYGVRQRQRELGVRSALGASPAQLLRLVTLRGLAPVGPGLGAGLVGALWSSRLLRSQLFELSPTDPATVAAVIAAVGAVALTACALPGLRAAAVDPAVVLREE